MADLENPKRPAAAHTQLGGQDGPGTLWFAGGGSGGHIYPGLAIAEHVRAISAARGQGPPAIRFVCSDRIVDARILNQAKASYEVSRARPVSLRPRGIVRFLRAWGPSVRQSRALLSAAKRQGPVHVVAMGGFVAAPFVQGARAERVEVTMVNLDVVPGKANRWIAPRCQRVFTAAPVDHEGAGKKFASWVVVPPVVRPGAASAGSPAVCRARLGLDPSRPVLMVTGGSQGLGSLNRFVTMFAGSEFGQVLRTGRWQVLHQTGGGFDQEARAAYLAAGVEAIVEPFTDEMGLWWGCADFAVCTAGAGTVSEVWLNAVPALMLPYPYHKDNHQRMNARVLEGGSAGPGRGAGVVVRTDHIDPGVNLREHATILAGLLEDGGGRERMRENLRSLGPADGAERVARALLDALKSLERYRA